MSPFALSKKRNSSHVHDCQKWMGEGFLTIYYQYTSIASACFFWTKDRSGIMFLSNSIFYSLQGLREERIQTWRRTNYYFIIVCGFRAGLASSNTTSYRVAKNLDQVHKCEHLPNTGISFRFIHWKIRPILFDERGRDHLNEGRLVNDCWKIVEDHMFCTCNRTVGGWLWNKIPCVCYVAFGIVSDDFACFWINLTHTV